MAESTGWSTPGTGGMLAISRPEASAILVAISAIDEPELAERLAKVSADLVAYIGA